MRTNISATPLLLPSPPKKHQMSTHVVVLVVRGGPRGRPRTAQINDVVSFTLKALQFGVVVEYRKDVKWNRFHVIRTDPRGARPYGQALWLDSQVITATGKKSKRPGVVFRQNLRVFGSPEQRACYCNCCVHLKGHENEPE